MRTKKIDSTTIITDWTILDPLSEDAANAHRLYVCNMRARLTSLITTDNSRSNLSKDSLH